jgi:hypothetical protein
MSAPFTPTSQTYATLTWYSVIGTGTLVSLGWLATL